jgi:nitroimidazol reductase NimA-like FMN-containing flavoprotein (pyridoxamine 5'-phosphate oxidase superfamily)
MPRNYDKIALTDDEKADLFAAADVARFATVGDDGLPHVVPVTFAVVDGELCFETDGDSIKVRNVEQTGKAAAVVDAGEDDYSQHRGIQWRGSARVVEDEETVADIERALFGAVKPDSFRQEGKHSRVKVALTPEREVSWDFRKAGGQ